MKNNYPKYRPGSKCVNVAFNDKSRCDKDSRWNDD